MHNYTERRREVLRNLDSLGAAQPDVMAGFSSLHTAAVADTALTPMTKELIALALAAATCGAPRAVAPAATPTPLPSPTWTPIPLATATPR